MTHLPNRRRSPAGGTDARPIARTPGNVLSRTVPRLLRGPTLFLLTAVVVAGALTAVPPIENRLRRHGIEQEVVTAGVVASLSIEAAVTAAELDRAALDAPTRAALDADIEQLRARGVIVGVEVWDREGRSLYGGPPGPPAAPTPAPLPEPRVLKVLGGEQPVVSDGSGRWGASVLETFQPLDPDRDGVVDGVVEIVLPRSRVDVAVSSIAARLRMGVGIVVALAGWAVIAFRRRLRLRRYQAEHDPLTGLGNRALLERLGANLSRGEDRLPADGAVDSALVLIDLDGFKRVNDTLGHRFGDEALVGVAGRLAGVIGTSDELVRLGGDEFAVLMANLDSVDAGDRLARRILGAMGAPFTVGGVSLQIGASIGIAPRSGDLDLGELLRRADIAMYQAKRGAGGYLRYSRDFDDNNVEHLSLLGDVQQAIAGDELVLNYQPKITANAELAGVEALVRWQHPTRGLLAPDTFLPLVEETALMKPLTTWVVGRAAEYAARIRADGLDVPVAVNVAPRTLLDTEFVALVDKALGTNDLPGRALVVEITETAILQDPDGARRVIEALRSRGVGVSIDDFGTGFTCLAHLKELPISEIKIDRGFVAGLLDHGVDHAIVAYTIRLAHDLDMPVVAEGVETQAAFNELRQLGCDQFQGFLIADPLDAEGFIRWARSRSSGRQAVFRDTA